MKQPIDPSDIREGDVIRFEYEAAATHTAIAYEYRAEGDWDSCGVKGQHFLLHRPERMVQVPESAIEELRDAQRRAYGPPEPFVKNSIRRDAIRDFLEAVDQANEAGDTDD